MLLVTYSTYDHTILYTFGMMTHEDARKRPGGIVLRMTWKV